MRRVFCALLLFAFFSVCLADASAARIVRYGFTIRNMGGSPAREVVFLARAPAQTGNQECLSLDASRGFELMADSVGNRVMRFRLGTLPPYAVVIIRIRAEVRRRETGGAESLDGFLSPTRLVESDAPEIRKMAARLSGDGALATAMNIHRWIVANISYSGFTAKERGALRALAARRGDCTEFADLFVALARAAGIPSRRVSGYVAPSDMLLAPSGYHDWAEFFHDGAWRAADPQGKVFAPERGDYIVFRIVSDKEKHPACNRFMVVGKGVEAKMNSR